MVYGDIGHDFNAGTTTEIYAYQRTGDFIVLIIAGLVP